MLSVGQGGLAGHGRIGRGWRQDLKQRQDRARGFYLQFVGVVACDAALPIIRFGIGRAGLLRWSLGLLRLFLFQDSANPGLVGSFAVGLKRIWNELDQDISGATLSFMDELTKAT